MSSELVFVTIEDTCPPTPPRKPSVSRIFKQWLWKRRKQFLLLFLCVLATYLLESTPRKSCWSSGCNRAWKAMLRNMDTSVAACDDFYKFACGGFEIDYGTTSLGNFNSLEVMQLLRASHLLGEPEGDNEFQGSGQAKRLYTSCVSYRKTQHVVKGKVDESDDGKDRIICASEIVGVMPTTVASMLMRRYDFSRIQTNIQAELVALLRSMIKSYLRTLENSDWGDKSTRSHAIFIANSIRACTMNFTVTEKNLVGLEYEKFDLKGTEYVAHIDRLKAISDEQHTEIKVTCFDTSGESSVEKITWKGPLEPTNVNAFYHKGINSILFSTAYLYSDLFSTERPNFLKYATTGFTYGHEIGHGVDRVNFIGDAYGDPNWLKQGLENPFTRSRNCLVNQFARYSPAGAEDVKVDGVRFLRENVADLAGFQVAYSAYDEWLRENGENDQKIEVDGLAKFTPRQLFWLSAANLKCGASSPQIMRRHLEDTNDTHAPNELRVIGAFSNIEEFARDFQCPLGSPMNRRNKCRVW